MNEGRVIVVTLGEPFPFGDANGRWYHVLLKGLVELRYEVCCLSEMWRTEWARATQEMLKGMGINLSFCLPGTQGNTSAIFPKASGLHVSAPQRQWDDG